MGANAPYVNTAGQVVPTYGASQSPQPQYGSSPGYGNQPAQYGNTGYASQPPQFPAYPPVSQQSDPLSSFGNLSLNSTGSGAGGYGVMASQTGSSHPPYQGNQGQGYGAPGYSQPGYNQPNQGGSWSQGPGPQPGSLSHQGSGNHQQQQYNAMPSSSYTPAPYSQQGGGPQQGGHYY